jgi:hypothetical protein
MRVFTTVLVATLVATTPVVADEVQVGRLSCEVAAGMGLIIGSSKDVSCKFMREGHATETYTGEINKLGIDIGKTESTHIEWLVLAAAGTNYETGALAGEYVGASGEATFGVGLGGNVLVGGSQRSFALQPFSVQAQTGFNLAVGLAGLTLR